MTGRSVLKEAALISTLPAARQPLAEQNELAVAKRGLTLFDKSRHAFLLLPGAESCVEETPLEAQSLGERGLEDPVDSFLDHHRHVLRHAGDACGDGYRLF